MRHKYVTIVTLTFVFATIQSVIAEQLSAEPFVELRQISDENADSECTQRGGIRVFVLNTHPEKIVDLQVDRYFDGVRQAGRSMFALAPGHTQALGCNKVMGAEQRWQLISTEFTSEHEAMQRYGSIQ